MCTRLYCFQFYVDIDPIDDSTCMYGRDIFNYIRHRDAKFVVHLGDSNLRDSREHLVDWLISVAHHYRCSQETVCHTINILDRCLAKEDFKKKYLQLLGITAFLIATKVINKVFEIFLPC